MSTTLVQNAPETPARSGIAKTGPYLIAAVVCLLISAVLRSLTGIDNEALKYRAREQGVHRVVGGDWFAGMLLGFREMVADLMWIQVDQYFHEGRFDKILPVCYVITTMDPGWVDVYTTGAWHLGYNFGDRRLVPAAIDFDRQGVRNNPENYDMRYELGWMEMSRGYNFKQAAIDFKAANDLHLRPLGKRHAWPHALEASGDINGAIAAWKELLREDPSDVVAKKQIFMANLRILARKDLGKHPVQVHLDLKLTRKGPRVIHVEGICNLPMYTKLFFDLRDTDWRMREKQSLAWQIAHYTLYSQIDTTLQPAWGMFQGEPIDFYQGTLRVHQGEKSYNDFPTEPLVPIVGGHMIVQDGTFHGDIDMAKYADQYPLESSTYELTFFINPRMEPITTQDIIGWNGEGMTGPLVHPHDGYNELTWVHTLKRSDIL